VAGWQGCRWQGGTTVGVCNSGGGVFTKKLLYLLLLEFVVEAVIIMPCDVHSTTAPLPIMNWPRGRVR